MQIVQQILTAITTILLTLQGGLANINPSTQLAATIQYPTGAHSLFTNQTPASLNSSDGSSVNYEAGMRFQSNTNGQIIAIRFWKSANESGSHTGRIWNDNGTELASVVFTNETASGWQEQLLSTPLNVVANTTYLVSVNTTNGYYVVTENGLANQISNGNLSSIASSNGRYGSVGQFPTQTWNNLNAFRDVVFVPSSQQTPGTPTPPPPPATTYTITGSSGTGGSISPSGSVTVSQGSSQTFTITPNSGYQISQVSVNGVNQGAISSYTFSNVNSNQAVSATFSQTQQTPPPTSGNTVTANSCSQTDVQAAVNAVSEGGTVLIPNGSCAWSTGISTTKQIIIRAQNYTPISGGSANRNVIITNNSSSPLFSMQSGNNYHVGVGGIRFNEGTGNANAIRFTGSGSKVPLLFDNYFQNKERFGSAEEMAVITWLAQGGVAWNIYIDGTGFGSGGDPGPAIGSISVHFKSPRTWYTASTMGTLDTNGTVNVYFENSTFVNTGGGDLDDNARVVMRYSTFDGSTWITHGFTSSWGGRHWESYNNTYQVTSALRNHAGMYFWSRAGHGIFTDNVVNNASASQNYGNPSQLRIGDNTNPTPYPQARQMGWGHNGTSNVIDPIYIWNNTGSRAYSYFIDSAWSSNVQLNRELYVNSGPKPGYSKYTYPHPFRTVITGGTTTPPPPATTYTITGSSGTGGSISPSGSVTVSQGSSQTFTITPNSGYQISQVSVNGVNQGAISSYTFSNVTSNRTISASFTQVQTPTSNTFSSNQRVQVNVGAGSNLNVRSTPTTSATPTGTQPHGALGTVISGGQSVDGYFWWNVNFDSGVDGYVVEDYLQSYTAPTPDTTAPSTPTNLSATAVSTSGINLSWTASTDSVGVTGYRVERCQGSSCSNYSQVGTPTSNSYSDSGLSANTTYRYRVRAVDGAGNLSAYSTVVNGTTQSVASAPAALPTGNNGIAASYPGDANIQSNPAVLFADGFESYNSASNLTSNWNSYYQGNQTSITTTSGNVFAGSKALEFNLPASGNELSNAVVKNLSQSQDTLFVRVYTKFDPNYDVNTDSNHNGIRISAGNYPGPGNPPNGSDFFISILENAVGYGEADPGYTRTYIYHPAQRSQWGDIWYPNFPYDNGTQGETPKGRILPFDRTAPGDYQGESNTPFTVQVERSDFVPQRGQWYSYEFMIKANTPGARDGRIAYWIDGNLMADYQGVSLRNTTNLKINQIQLELHAQSRTGTNPSKKWYDNLVVATSYIGPMTAGSTPPPTPSDTTAPSTPTNLSATAVSTSGINLSWSASTDAVGVTGYRVERCTGASCSNYSQIGAPSTNLYSDSGLSANTTYRYRVRATDAAGNLSGYSTVVSGTTQQIPQTPTSNTFSPNQRVQITSNVQVRSTAGGTSLGTQNLGAIGTIVSGGQQVSLSGTNYFWWNVNFDSGVDGYVVENFLSPYTAPVQTLTGDFNGDGAVNSLDASILISLWDQTQNISNYDLNNDGIINSLDYSLLLSNWTN